MNAKTREFPQQQPAPPTSRAAGSSPNPPQAGSLKRLVLALSCLLATVPLSASGQTVVWSEDFEGPTPGWSADGGIWEIGVPTSGPNAAHSGIRCAATNLSGIYAGGVDSRLISPAFVVPAVATAPPFPPPFGPTQ